MNQVTITFKTKQKLDKMQIGAIEQYLPKFYPEISGGPYTHREYGNDGYRRGGILIEYFDPYKLRILFGSASSQIKNVSKEGQNFVYEIEISEKEPHNASEVITYGRSRPNGYEYFKKNSADILSNVPISEDVLKGIDLGTIYYSANIDLVDKMLDLELLKILELGAFDIRCMTKQNYYTGKRTIDDIIVNLDSINPTGTINRERIDGTIPIANGYYRIPKKVILKGIIQDGKIVVRIIEKNTNDSDDSEILIKDKVQTYSTINSILKSIADEDGVTRFKCNRNNSVEIMFNFYYNIQNADDFTKLIQSISMNDINVNDMHIEKIMQILTKCKLASSDITNRAIREDLFSDKKIVQEVYIKVLINKIKNQGVEIILEEIKDIQDKEIKIEAIRMLGMALNENHESVSEAAKETIKNMLIEANKNSEVDWSKDFFCIKNEGGITDYYSSAYGELLSKVCTQEEKQNIIFERFAKIEKPSATFAEWEFHSYVNYAIKSLFSTKTEIKEWINLLKEQKKYGLLEIMAKDFSYSQRHFEETEKTKRQYYYIGYELQEMVAKILTDHYIIQGIDTNEAAMETKPDICKKYLEDIKTKERDTALQSLLGEDAFGMFSSDVELPQGFIECFDTYALDARGVIDSNKIQQKDIRNNRILIFVPSEYIGKMIGKGGKNINENIIPKLEEALAKRGLAVQGLKVDVKPRERGTITLGDIEKAIKKNKVNEKPSPQTKGKGAITLVDIEKTIEESNVKESPSSQTELSGIGDRSNER